MTALLVRLVVRSTTAHVSPGEKVEHLVVCSTHLKVVPTHTTRPIMNSNIHILRCQAGFSPDAEMVRLNQTQELLARLEVFFPTPLNALNEQLNMDTA